MAYEINPDATFADCASVQAFSLRKGDDQIRTGVPALRADCLTINRDAAHEGFHPSFDAKPHSQRAVHHPPISATRKVA